MQIRAAREYVSRETWAIARLGAAGVLAVTLATLPLPTSAFGQTPHKPAVTRYEEGVRYLRQQNWKAAVAAFEKALELNPNDASARRNLDEVLQRNGRSPAPRGQK